jgi:Tfp pilus assembly protein PilN
MDIDIRTVGAAAMTAVSAIGGFVYRAMSAKDKRIDALELATDKLRAEMREIHKVCEEDKHKLRAEILQVSRAVSGLSGEMHNMRDVQKDAQRVLGKFDD